MESIRILGAFGGKGVDMTTTTIQVNEKIVIDAGNIVGPVGPAGAEIDHIFLSHSHLDHIADIPFLIDAFFEAREKPIFIYGLEETLMDLKEYIFNWKIWPDFNQIQLIHNTMNAIMFIPVDEWEEIGLEDVTLKTVPSNHIVPTVGYAVWKNGRGILYTADTYLNDATWEMVNGDPSITTVIIDVSFPSRLDKLAEVSKHLTPALLAEELKKLTRDDVTVHVYHLKPNYVPQISKELEELGALRNGGRVLRDGEIVEF